MTQKRRVVAGEEDVLYVEFTCSMIHIKRTRIEEARETKNTHKKQKGKGTTMAVDPIPLPNVTLDYDEAPE